MSANFDPYHKWLGISPREQPPNHYRLLAIDLYESDPEVIDSAANRQMSYLQELASGPNVKHAQKLLNEIAAARVCLLDEDQRDDYDTELKNQNGAIQEADEQAQSKPSRPQPTATAVKKETRPAKAASRTDKKPIATASPIVVGARGSSDQRRAAHHTGRKSNSQTAIVASVILVGILVLGGIALALTLGGDSEDALAKGGDSKKPEVTQVAKRDGRAKHEQDDTPTVKPDDKGENQPSDIPEPGSNPDPKPTEPNDEKDPPNGKDPNVDDPNENDPPNVVTPMPEAGPPPMLTAAYEALGQKNIPEVIAKLEECLAGEPKAPYKEEVENLLGQAKTAISKDAIKKSLEAWLEKRTDQEVQTMANTNRVTLDPVSFPFPVKNQPLREVFLQGVGQFISGNEWPPLVVARLDRKPDQVAVKPDMPDPGDPDNKDPGNGDDPDDGKPDEPATLPRPSDPAELLAAEGLKKNGNRWYLTDEELALREQVTKVSALHKKLTDARKAVPLIERQKLARGKQILKQHEAAKAAFLNEIKERGVITGQEQGRLTKMAADITKIRKQVDGLAGKISEFDVTADSTAEELRPELEVLSEKVTFVEETYDRLRNDEEVIAALEKQGGTITSSSTVVKSAKSKAAKVLKDIGD
jgi:hypothetical protein